MSEQIQQETIVGTEPTAEELELVMWAEEAVRKSLDRTRDSLKQMVTITVALLAGSTAFFNQLPIPLAAKIVGVGVVLVSLIVSLRGGYPYEAMVDTESPDDIRRLREKATSRAVKCLKWSSILLVAGFAILLGGILGGLTVAPH